MVNKNILVFVQARETSSRFPQKVFKKINNRTIMDIIHTRLKQSKYIDDIIYLIPNNNTNKLLHKFLKDKRRNIFLGDEKNVLSRFYFAYKKYKPKIIIRITADCPLVDSKILDKMLIFFENNKFDYLSNCSPPTFPDGFDIEIFKGKNILLAYKNAKTKYYKEHVTTYFKDSKKFKIGNYLHNLDYSFLKLSVDTKQDLKNIKKIFDLFSHNIHFSYEDIIKKRILTKIFKNEISAHYKFLNKTKTGQKFWKKANQLIADGNMLLSKKPERYLPGLWPTYFIKAKGCNITDYDGNNFIDMSLMGVGTNVLGYSNNFVDRGVKEVLGLGNMSTLNCYEEVRLAEKLLDIHKHFDKVKFARSGGEANAIAIRLARAASGKDNIAICGYHGWHDWYLSANLNSKKSDKLKNHLVKGLDIEGVPKKLKKTVFPFDYGNIKQLNSIIKNNNIGAIKMEVCRNTKPDLKFLKYIRKITLQKKIVLIFDECTTGFRESLGGLHLKTNIFPDMCIFGKAMGNGYAITAVLGKEEIMNSVKNTFVSSTFWTERIGPTAALRTIKYMEINKTWSKVEKIGKKIQQTWLNIAKNNKLKIKINGIPSLTNFTFESENHQKYRTLISQEMFKSNILATNAIYPSICHSEKILNNYFDNLNNIFRIIKLCEDGSDIKKYLKVEESTRDFKRMN